MTLRYQNLWNGCVGAWCPSLGATGYTLMDRSGYGNHGTLTNMTADDWVASDGKFALEFTYANLTEVVQTTKEITLGSNFTISFWLKQKTTSPSDWLRIIVGDSDVSKIAYMVDFGSMTTVQWFINGSIDSYTVPNMTTKWSHHCLVFESGVRKELFVDGKSMGSVAQTASVAASYLYFGNRSAIDRNYDGYLDDIRVYNLALSSSGIKTLALRRGIAYERNRTVSVRGATVGGGPVIPVFRHHYQQQGVA